MTPVAPQDADPAKISGISDVRRRHDAGKADRRILPKSEPPMAPVEQRDWCTVEESQAMQLGEDISHFIVASIHLANTVYRRQDLRHRLARSISLAEKPFARAQDSAAASPYWATAR